MKRSVFAISVSFIASIASLLCYLSDFPSAIPCITYKQMNDLLLAVFGAGISILPIELLGYVHDCNNLEKRLLKQVERQISLFAGMKQLSFESVGDFGSEKTCELLRDYFDEASLNMLPGIAFPTRHDARNKLIQAIENCSEPECDSYASDEASHFNLFMQRAHQSIRDSFEGYRFSFDTANSSKGQLIQTLEDLSYLPIRAFWRGKPIKMTRKYKKEQLESIKKLIERDYRKLEDVAKQCRLFECEHAGYSDLIDAFLACEDSWLEDVSIAYGDSTYHSRNKFARELYDRVSKFANYSNSPDSPRYTNTPWW